MNYPDPASPRWCYPDNTAGELAAEDYHYNNNIADMFGDYTTDDLFDLVWRGGGGGLTLDLELEEPAVSCHPLSPRFKPPTEARVPKMLPSPSSEDQMAAWLYAIVKDKEHAHAGGACEWTDNNGRRAPSSEKSSETSVEAKGTSVEKSDKLRTAEDTATKETGSEDSRKRRKITAGAMSQHGETHKLAEKRRRSKINERIKTLQHLVPGCDKSSYNSTLQHTIQYMKSLQQQIQALTGGPSPPAAAAMNPVVQPQYVPPGPPATLAAMIILGPPPMVPLGPVLPLPHYPAPIVMMPAAARPLHPATPTPRFAPTAYAALGGDRAAACAGKSKRS